MQGIQNGNLFIVVAKKKMQILVIILQGVENEYFFIVDLGKLFQLGSKWCTWSYKIMIFKSNIWSSIFNGGI